MLNPEPVALRFKEIDSLLRLLANYRAMSAEEFRRQPKHFGGAARFIQLIMKYCIEIAAQIAFANGVEIKDYRQSFQSLEQLRVIDRATAQEMSRLLKFYALSELPDLKIRDLYKTIPEIETITGRLTDQVKSWMKNQNA